MTPALPQRSIGGMNTPPSASLPPIANNPDVRFLGTLLGDAGVNIGEYHQARLAQGGEALAVVSVDGVVAADVWQRLCELPDINTASVVQFREA